MAPLETYWLVVLSIAGTIVLILVVVLALALFIDMIGTIMERRIEKHRTKRNKKYDVPQPQYSKYVDSSDLYGKP